MQQEFLSRKECFDPNKEEHLSTFKSFLKTNKWEKGCPFFLEWPYNSIPDMIKDKIIRNMFDVKVA
jgi:hypothetical protein